MPLTIALCDACPSTEVDEMTISLLNIFDSRGLGSFLLEGLIDHEVEQTGTCMNLEEPETSLMYFRRERS
jgi:hypothetical protein